MKRLSTFSFLIFTFLSIQTFGQNQGGETCAQATALGTLGGPSSCPGGAGFVGESTATAGLTTQNPSCDGIGSNYDLWYSFVAPSTGVVQLNIDLGTAGRIEAAVWSDCSTEIFCSSSHSDGVMIMNLTPGTTYYLQLWSDSFVRGSFDFCLFAKEGPPSNNTCSSPEILSIMNGSDPCSVGGSSATFNNFGASASGETPFPSCGNFGAGIDVWFSVTVPASGDVSIEMTEAIGPQDWAMSIYKGMCGSLTEVECDDDDGNGLKPKIDLLGRTAGEELLIRIWEIGGDDFGSFKLLASEPNSAPPSNDLCAAAIDITSLLGQSGGCAPLCGHNVNSTASGETPIPSCGSFGAGKDVWYKVEIPNQGGFNAELSQYSSAGPQDWAMAVYSGSCGSLVEEACDDDSGPSLYPKLSVNNLTPGSFVYIRIWEFQGDGEGSFNICLTPLTPLALQFIEVKGSMEESGNSISCQLLTKQEISKIEFYSSTDGNVWKMAHDLSDDQIENKNLWFDETEQLVSYYRVNAVLADGSTEMSNVIMIERNGGLVSFQLNVTPNPVKQLLEISMNSSNELSSVDVTIYDLQGKMVMSQEKVINSQSGVVKIDVGTMSSGTYILKAVSNGEIRSIKFVKS